MHMSMSLVPAQRQAAKMEQRQNIELQLASTRLALINLLRDDSLSPRGVCPSCDKHLTHAEILRGFRDDVTDYTTECPSCKRRFHPILYRSEMAGSISLAFYCAAQTLDQLYDLEHLSPAEILKDHPAIYGSAIAHFGGLKQAFAKIHRDYPYEEKVVWRERVVEFLGQLPDAMIAEIVGASARTIGNLRRQHKVPRFQLSSVTD